MFEQALKENRPAFVDYFLRRHHDPLNTQNYCEWHRKNRPDDPNIIYHEVLPAMLYAIQFLVKDLYQESSNTDVDQVT